MSTQQWNSANYANNAAFVSDLGLAVVDLLAPQPGEYILDLGCGEGTLAKELERYGCRVLGVDYSEDMVQSAQDKGVQAQCCSGEALMFNQQFDAVFSNAALHWMQDYRAVLQGVHQALKDQGRFVAEFGGFGNIQAIRTAIEAVYTQNPQFGQYQSPWFFPSAEHYQDLLQQAGFKVVSIELIPRPTPLTSGIREWLSIFAEHAMAHLDADSKSSFLDQVEAYVRPELFSAAKGWHADYVRLRFVAHKA